MDRRSRWRCAPGVPVPAVVRHGRQRLGVVRGPRPDPRPHRARGDLGAGRDGRAPRHRGAARRRVAHHAARDLRAGARRDPGAQPARRPPRARMGPVGGPRRGARRRRRRSRGHARRASRGRQGAPGREAPGAAPRGRLLTFARLRPAEWVVFVAALALLFTTAPDWYSTKTGDEARRIQQDSRAEEGQPIGETEAETERAAEALAEAQERNAWQEDGTVDRVILILLLATAALGVAAGFLRASGRGSGPYAVAGAAASVTALLV